MLSLITTVATIVFVATAVGLGELAVSVLCFYIDENVLGTALLILTPLCLGAVIWYLITAYPPVNQARRFAVLLVLILP